MNEKTQTKYTTKSFTVYDDSFDKNSVQLISPENYKILNYNSLKFIWHDVEEASSYMLQVKKDNWSTGESFEQLTTADTVAAINLPDGVYYWGVKAINNKGLSTDYSYRKLEVDTKLPEIPTLLAPIDGFETALRNLSFSWKMGTGTIDNIVYQFEVHKIVAGVDQLLFTSSTSSTGIEYKFAETGSYYWRVRAVDLAGNLSQYSVSNSIIIKDEKDISAITVKLLSPADTISTTLSKITFWWEKVDGSTVYVFQLIRPNFTKPEELISDVEITTNQIIIDLPKKDSYQWRVKAKNGISETKYTTRTITLK
jgi:hypothetical protein